VRRRPAIETVRWLCHPVQPVLLSEDSLLALDAPISVCGDICGQYLDLLRVSEMGGMPPKSRYFFLGDSVDRGSRSVEVSLLLFALKLRYPDAIHLVRGNMSRPR
jgi:serine/threonine-protein phosphatase PP1 catalytic subunit